jgi:hypothetical protein
MNDGQYEGAIVRFRRAAEQLNDLNERYPSLPQVKALQRDLDQARAANRAACRAEREIAEKRGEQGPECP